MDSRNKIINKINLSKANQILGGGSECQLTSLGIPPSSKMPHTARPHTHAVCSRWVQRGRSQSLSSGRRRSLQTDVAGRSISCWRAAYFSPTVGAYTIYLVSISNKYTALHIPATPAKRNVMGVPAEAKAAAMRCGIPSFFRRDVRLSNFHFRTTRPKIL